MSTRYRPGRTASLFWFSVSAGQGKVPGYDGREPDVDGPCRLWAPGLGGWAAVTAVDVGPQDLFAVPYHEASVQGGPCVVAGQEVIDREPPQPAAAVGHMRDSPQVQRQVVDVRGDQPSPRPEDPGELGEGLLKAGQVGESQTAHHEVD